MLADVVPLDLNREIAARLREMADTLEEQGEDGFRVGAYRRAAGTLGGLKRPVEEIIERTGIQGLIDLPTIGEGIANAIVEMATTGRWSQLERVTGRYDPEGLFRTVPGIGPTLARRIHDELQVDTLEQLENAIAEGRLERIDGLGPRRAAAISAQLAERLGRRRARPRAEDARALPPVAMLLDVDREYRQKAGAGALRKIAPKRFNPKGAAWLPILHVQRGDWRFTALYSNTRQAHELGKTGDWVVLYFHDAGAREFQCTIVTEGKGPMKGRRVVRGREEECLVQYRSTGSAPQ